MKILMLSIFAPHFFNWTAQLKDSGHEIYWLDVFDSNTKVEKIDFAHQITGWRYRWNFPGRYFIKRKAPKVTRFINKVNERRLSTVLEQKIKEVEPDVVHSFVMYLSTAPILSVMKKFPEIKWIYSSWGSDLFYYRNLEKEHANMKKTFPRIDYMFADCKRDYAIAAENGFNGEFLGKFPGGGGFDFNQIAPFITPLSQRKLILIKGYQGLHGRCIAVLKALLELKEGFRKYKLVVFGASEEVRNFVLQSELKDWENLQVLEKISHSEVIKLMGKALVYMGNSKSDGTPNTLLEAIVMGAFPIQSNPGGATAEIIEHGKNGLLIEDPEDIGSIQGMLQDVLIGKVDIFSGMRYNLKEIKPDLEREKIKKKVLSQYSYIEQKIKNEVSS